MQIHADTRGGARPRGRTLLRLLSRALLAAGLALALPAAVLGQVTFTSQATVSYQLSGLTRQSGFSDVHYGAGETLSTNNPFAQPVQVSKSVGGTLGSGGAMSSLFADVNGVGSAGLMRAAFSGSTSASWTTNQTSTGQLNGTSHVTVSWRDAYIVSGNPANPQPGRALIVQSFLNVSGNMGYTLTDPALEFGNDFAGSYVAMSMQLFGQDNFGRPLFPGQSAAEQDQTRTGLGPGVIHIPPPGIVPVQLQVLEGEMATMRFELRVSASASSTTASQYFGADSTSTTFNADFGHTITWGGITSVTDAATGQPVTGWSIASASGVNYANPVPEPASALPLLALAAVAIRRRPLNG